MAAYISDEYTVYINVIIVSLKKVILLIFWLKISIFSAFKFILVKVVIILLCFMRICCF